MLTMLHVARLLARFRKILVICRNLWKKIAFHDRHATRRLCSNSDFLA